MEEILGRKPVEVVAAVIRDAEGRVLIAQRPQDKHQGGKWEFPGGKVEAGESRRSALARELHEELGIEVTQSARLISVYHEYEDKAVYLDVYEVVLWRGTPCGNEGQPIQWVQPDALSDFEFPEANAPIIDSVILPKFIKIISPVTSAESFKKQVLASLQFDPLPYLYYDFLEAELTHEQLNWLLDTAAAHQTEVIIQSPPPLIRGDYNLHLSANELLKANVKPGAKRVSATCSTPEELFKAQRLGLDFVFVGPVIVSSAGGDHGALGWPAFQSLVGRVNMPVYAMGGLNDKSLERAREYGAQGVVTSIII
ncbi:MAG: pyrophosphohydrolase [Proteobacteria bacterium]|nr:MAG: pyrophosphohydrolase [Pseudomonadota bacterium]